MIIVIASDVPLTENNGTAVAACNLIRSLRKKGHTVRILCPDKTKLGEPDYYITKTLNLGPLNGYVKKNGVLISKPDRALTAKALDGADILHIMTPFFLCTSALRMAVKMGIPVTAGFHCQAENFSNHIFLMNSGWANRCVYRIFYNNLYSKTACIHYPTEFIKRTFENSVGKKPNGVVISNGVGSEFSPERHKKPREYANKRVIVFTGRYSREKSHTVLIRAAALSKHRDEIQLVFAGDGPQRENLEKLSRKILPIMPVMKFFPRKELVNILQYADLYVHPAEIEIEAIACLEAIKCGLVPVISNSERSATRYFALDEKNLFRCNDARDLAEKIDYWLDSPDKVNERRIEYMNYTSDIDRDICMDKMEKMLTRVVSEHRGGKA